MYTAEDPVLELRNGTLYTHGKPAIVILTKTVIRIGCTTFDRKALRFVVKSVAKFDKSKKERLELQPPTVPKPNERPRRNTERDPQTPTASR